MASNLYRVRTGSGSTASGRRLLDRVDNLWRAWTELVAERDAILQQRDADSDPDAPTDFDTSSKVYAFVDAADAISDDTALAAFLELDSCYGAANAAIIQLAARLRQ